MTGIASFGGENGGVEETQGDGGGPGAAWGIGCAEVVISDVGGS